MSLFPVQGIDVSHWQEDVDWSKVIAAGYNFGYYKATEGIVKDKWHDSNKSETTSLKFINGQYHFWHHEMSCERQVEVFCNVVGNFDSMPPAWDVEAVRNNGVYVPPYSKTEMEARLQTCLTLLEKMSGRTPMIYTAQGYWNANFPATSKIPAKYPLWVANYKTTKPRMPAGWGSWKIWQWAENGVVSGVPGGSCDMNYWHGTLEELKAFANNHVSLPTQEERLDKVFNWAVSQGMDQNF